MEKPSKPRNNFLNFLSKAASAFTFRSPPLSPKTVGAKTFGGKGLSIIPAEARRKHRSGSFDAREPTSPKVSCIGQIKKKKKTSKSKLVLSLPAPETVAVSGGGEVKKNPNCCVFDDKPSLIQMKKFASGRELLVNFDWRDNGSQKKCLDGEKKDGKIRVEAKKEVKLWKRRNKAPPPVLQL